MKPILLLVLCSAALVSGCRQASPQPAAGGSYDPLAFAASMHGQVGNLEAAVPPMCYTQTGGDSNPCWVCHTKPVGKHFWTDVELQEEYAFSDVALTNHWTNLFADRRPFIASMSDAAMLEYVRGDNYAPLREALSARADFTGYVPDLDFSRGFDAEGFARDGSGWRAIRYQPFLGSFWPTNGSTDDVFIRLPAPFRRTAAGLPSQAVYRQNLAILERAIATAEPPAELPTHFVGGAASVDVIWSLYPKGTEFLHSVRYLDPDAPTQMAHRMKELRYSRKVELHDDWGLQNRSEREIDDKEAGRTPVYRGSEMAGLITKYGWQLQGFIEDASGRLRLQTEEEHRFCMGCHGGIGVLVDGTFAFPRKVPGADGWRVHDLRGLVDRPQAGHLVPEILTYFRRVRGGDETRANAELLTRFFPDDVLDEAAVGRAASGGDRDLAWLLFPSRERAMALNKAYLAIVREQSFVRGRDAVLQPATRVHARIDGNGSTALGKTGKIFPDGRLHLDWSSAAAIEPAATASRD